MRITHNYFFYIILLLFVFYDEFFFSVLALTGINHVSGLKTYEAVPMALAAYLMLAYDIFKRRIDKRTVNVLLYLFVLLILYITTQIFFVGKMGNYRSGLLLFGAESIPMAIIGARLAKSNPSSMAKMDRLLPFFSIPIAFLIGTIGLRYVNESILMVGDDTGMSYQSISYAMAFCYTYSAYYVFFSPLKGKKYYKVLRLLMIPTMLFCAIICLTSGGRGAFVLIAAVTLYIIFTLRNSMKGYFGKFLIIVLSLSVVFMVVSTYMGVWESAGMSRVMHSLTKDVERARLYSTALETFLESPLVGQGVGSIWFTVGFYSHNMVLDWLAETGVIGTSLFSYILYRTAFYLYHLIKHQKIAIFLSIVFLGALIYNTFSGYYLGAGKLFFVSSFVYVYNVPAFLKRVESKQVFDQ